MNCSVCSKKFNSSKFKTIDDEERLNQFNQLLFKNHINKGDIICNDCNNILTNRGKKLSVLSQVSI